MVVPVAVVRGIRRPRQQEVDQAAVVVLASTGFTLRINSLLQKHTPSAHWSLVVLRLLLTQRQELLVQ